MSENCVALGAQVPPFDGLSTAGPFRLDAHRGRTLVLYFYPKDHTPGCTTETQEFGDACAEFVAANAIIFGISRDTIESHHRFKDALGIPFDLISDPDEVLCTLFDVMKTKNLYGRKVRGVERSTFVIDSGGVLARQWRGVKVPGHVAEVLDCVKAMQP